LGAIFSFLKDGWVRGVGGSLIGGGGKGFFFFQSGWVQAFKYLFLVVGGVGDTWIYPNFCIFLIIGCGFMFQGLELRGLREVFI
jgi:hypothetical protein